MTFHAETTGKSLVTNFAEENHGLDATTAKNGMNSELKSWAFILFSHIPRMRSDYNDLCSECAKCVGECTNVQWNVQMCCGMCKCAVKCAVECAECAKMCSR